MSPSHTVFGPRLKLLKLYESEHFDPQSVNTLLKARVPERLLSSLYKFQLEGVIFGVKAYGRVLIADEMGIGKTLQAIALAWYYRADWPLLVVVPSFLKRIWR